MTDPYGSKTYEIDLKTITRFGVIRSQCTGPVMALRLYMKKDKTGLRGAIISIKYSYTLYFLVSTIILVSFSDITDLAIHMLVFKFPTGMKW